MKKALFTLMALAFVFSVNAQIIDTIKSNGSDTVIYEKPSIQAQFPGGMGKLYRFLAKTTRYPASGVEHHIEGKVILRLLIEKDGSISDIKVIQSVSEDIDKEAVRVLKIAPKFIPAKKLNGEPVRSYFIFPFSFTLG